MVRDIYNKCNVTWIIQTVVIISFITLFELEKFQFQMEVESTLNYLNALLKFYFNDAPRTCFVFICRENLTLPVQLLFHHIFLKINNWPLHNLPIGFKLIEGNLTSKFSIKLFGLILIPCVDFFTWSSKNLNWIRSICYPF